MCFLWGKDKPIELSWVLNKRRILSRIVSYSNTLSSQTIGIQFPFRAVKSSKFHPGEQQSCLQENAGCRTALHVLKRTAIIHFYESGVATQFLKIGDIQFQNHSPVILPQQHCVTNCALQWKSSFDTFPSLQNLRSFVCKFRLVRTSQQAFRRNISPLSSGSKSRTKYNCESRWQCTSEMSDDFQRAGRRCIPQDGNLHEKQPQSKQQKEKVRGALESTEGDLKESNCKLWRLIT
jgi:hypothetical protein